MALVYQNPFKRLTPEPLAGYLKSTFPEIANTAIASLPWRHGFEIEGVIHKLVDLPVDSSFFNMFDVKIDEGKMNFFLLPWTSENANEIRKIAITREKALQLFGNESSVGKRMINENGVGEYIICAVVTGLPEHSNYSFDILAMIKANQADEEWRSNLVHTLVELVPGIDMEAFEKKLYEHTIPPNDIKHLTLTPLTSVRYTSPDIERDVQFQHIIIFAVSGFFSWNGNCSRRTSSGNYCCAA
jgi:hypothetical protein